MSNSNFYIPESNLLKLNESLEDIIDEYTYDMNKIMDIYKKWKFYEGKQKEIDVAKLFLPLASTTDLVVSGNYQALYEFLQLRNCVRAEGEIRELSLEITKIMKEILPQIFGDLGCKGDYYKTCNEYNSCGKYPRKEELI
jgi:thymidylate synthase (FAD)